MLNQLLGGRYKVIRALGEGGLAKTYIVEDCHRPGHPKCAVKFLKPASKNPNFLPTARRLFNKEAEILEKLGCHDQIPQLLAYFEDKHEFYLVQEFIEGHPLIAELPPGLCWSESEVILMLHDVLRTLKFVHSYQVIHRDIKPHNLIRRRKDGRLVLIDFGIVKEVRNPQITAQNSPTRKTISIGTQGYIPAEQIRGKPRLNSDIYALGMIGIQALTGVDPLYLQEDEEGEVIWKNRAKVSDRLAEILTGMVRYHFKERYQNATEVLEALESLANFASSTNKISPKVAPEPEQRKAQISLLAEKQNAKAVAEPKLRNMKVAPKLGQASPEAIAESKGKEDNIALDSNPWIPWNKKAVSEEELSKTKIVLKTEQPNIKLSSEPKLKEMKVSLKNRHFNKKTFTQGKLNKAKNNLDTKQQSAEVISQAKISQANRRETKVSPRNKHLNLELFPDKKREETKVDLEKPTVKLTTNKKENFSLVSLGNSLAPLNNLDSNHQSILVKLKKSKPLFGTGIASVLILTFAGYRYINHRKFYWQEQKALGEIEILKATENYPECIKQAQIFTQDYSDLQAETETLLYECQQGQAKRQLAEAKKLTEQSRFKEAIALVAQVSTDMDVYSEAQQLIHQLSEKIFQIASKKYQEGNLKEATEIVKVIPTDSPLADKVETTIQQWNEEWKQNQTNLQVAQKALDESRWQDAIDTAQQVSDTDYWQKQKEPIIQQAEAGIADAQATASRKAYPVPRKTYNSPQSSSAPRRTYSSSPSSFRRKPLPRREPIPSTAPFPIPRSRSTPPRPRSSSTEWTCLNNPNPKCHK